MKSKKEGSLTPLSLLSNNVSVQHSATRVARHTSKHKIISTNILSKSLQHKLFPKHPGDGKEQERIGKPSGSHCQSGRIHLDRDGWSMGIEQRGSISDQRESRFNQWAPNPAKEPTRERRASLSARRSPGPAYRHTQRIQSERELTWSCCKSKRFQYWNIDPALAAILRHIETEWKADRESARGAGVQREREREAGERAQNTERSRSNGAGARGMELSNECQPAILNRATENNYWDRPK